MHIGRHTLLNKTKQNPKPSHRRNSYREDQSSDPYSITEFGLVPCDYVLKRIAALSSFGVGNGGFHVGHFQLNIFSIASTCRLFKVVTVKIVGFCNL